MNLVKISEEEFGVIFDLRYASDNNVCGHPLYAYDFCYLHEDAAKSLKKAVFEAKKLGYKIKIFDAFRPLAVQQYMFEKFPDDVPNGGFISNPQTGAIPHCRGIAIDLTLVDLQGNAIDMGSDFDEFSSLAFHDCEDVSDEVRKNRIILLGIMTKAGFDFFVKEWWHYQLFKPREYDIVDYDPKMSLV